MIPFYKELELNKELGTNRFSPSMNDAYGDYDGDGVPNAVELFIGKNPTKPDVLGIKLTVAVGWNANQTYLTQLIKGFQRASQVVYDYTDGYAMITEIKIKNNAPEGSKEWNESMIRIRPFNGTGFYTTFGAGYWAWYMNYARKDMFNVVLNMTWDSHGPYEKVYYGGIAHELGHFVFGIGDEYITHKIYNKNTGKYESIFYTDIKARLERYNISFQRLPTIMERGDKWSEVSTLNDYMIFNDQLQKYESTLIAEFNNTGWQVDSWEDFTTAHWEITYTIDGVEKKGISAWDVIYALLSMDHTIDYEWVTGVKTGNYGFRGILIDIKPSGYTPFAGPYTGVGFYLEVRSD